MALSAHVTRELRRELASLQASRTAIDERIRALQSVLGGSHALTGSEQLLPVNGDDSRKQQSRPPKPTPLRATVLAALQRLSHGKAADIVADLESRGIEVGGSTTLRERVSHELSRLRRKGVVRRRYDRYEIATPPMVEAVDAPPMDLAATR